MDSKGKTTDILREDRPELGSRRREGREEQWEVLLFSNSFFPGLSLQVLESLTTLQRKLKSYCGECTDQQVRVRVSADGWITEGKGPPLFLLT